VRHISLPATSVVTMMVVIMSVTMAMRVIVAVRMLGVSATLRIERRFNCGEPPAQSIEHRFESGIGPYAQAVGENLHRHMPVAQMPGQTRQVGHVVAANLDQRFGLDHYFNKTAIVQFKHIAVAQQHRPGKHRADSSAVHTGEMPRLQAALL